MLHAFSTKLRAAVGALKVTPDSGECIEALELIASLPLEGALVTGDAAFTTEAIPRAIRERGGHYFLFVKDNQPELVSELERAGRVEDARLRHDDLPPAAIIAAEPGLTADKRRDPPDLTWAETIDEGYGRIERIRETKDRCSREVICAITSAPPEAFDAAALLKASRDHWSIENCEFHVRDVRFREDASR